MSKKQIWSRVIPLAVAVIGSGAAYLGLCVPRQKELVPPEPRFAAVLIDAKTKSFINDASIMLIGKGIPAKLGTDDFGNFHIPMSQLSTGVRIEIRAEGYEPLSMNVAPSDETVQIKLKPIEAKPRTDPPDKLEAKEGLFLASVSSAATKLYGDRFNRTSHIRKQFDSLFNKSDNKTLSSNEDYFKNYCRFCFVAMPLHADTFNQWFADSSDGEKRSFFEGMKAAVLSDDFREKANTHVEKIDPALSFTVGGDVFSKSSIADELLEHINK